jgi:hypothetical protein
LLLFGTPSKNLNKTKMKSLKVIMVFKEAEVDIRGARAFAT